MHKACALKGSLCFGLRLGDPNSNCVAEKDCDIQVSIFKDKEHEGKVGFQLMGTPPLAKKETPSYIAVGISLDDTMACGLLVYSYY